MFLFFQTTLKKIIIFSFPFEIVLFKKKKKRSNKKKKKSKLETIEKIEFQNHHSLENASHLV